MQFFLYFNVIVKGSNSVMFAVRDLVVDIVNHLTKVTNTSSIQCNDPKVSFYQFTQNNASLVVRPRNIKRAVCTTGKSIDL